MVPHTARQSHVTACSGPCYLLSAIQVGFSDIGPEAATEMSQKLVAKLDKDGDGMVSKEELRAFLENMQYFTSGFQEGRDFEATKSFYAQGYVEDDNELAVVLDNGAVLLFNALFRKAHTQGHNGVLRSDFVHGLLQKPDLLQGCFGMSRNSEAQIKSLARACINHYQEQEGDGDPDVSCLPALTLPRPCLPVSPTPQLLRGVPVMPMPTHL